MESVRIKTYLRKLYLEEQKKVLDSEDFFLIDDEPSMRANADWFEGYLIYIEGVITMEVNNVQLLDFKDWDYPFTFWYNCYSQLESIAKGNAFELPFADEPRSILIDPINNDKYLVKLSSYNEGIQQQVSVSKKDFLLPLLQAAKKSFDVANQYLNGECRRCSDGLQEAIQKILFY
jgi:hypothetical protein